jgi:hypothetical protein
LQSWEFLHTLAEVNAGFCRKEGKSMGNEHPAADPKRINPDKNSVLSAAFHSLIARRRNRKN